MRILSPVSTVLILLFSVLAGAAQAAQGPRETIVKTVERITERIEEDRQRLKKDPDYARQVVREELVDLVDFKRITRLVMAEHFDAASREQKYRFLEVFKSSLINTYASGLTLYDGQDIRVLPVREGDVRGDRARVRMEVSTNSGQVIPIFYSLFRDKDGWKVENVIVNGLNLGKTFRSQFAQSMSEYGGDIDKVIANWSPDLNIDGVDADDPAEQAGKGSDAADAANGDG